jgi:hypothetical protein
LRVEKDVGGGLMGSKWSKIEEVSIDGVKVEAKICRICDTLKPLTDFHKNKGKVGGRDSRCKECAKLLRRQRYLNNRETYLEKDKIYRENNKEKVLERHRKYRLANKEKIRESAKIYGIKNREKIKSKRENYYQRNKEYYRKWRLANKDKIAHWTHKRRTNKLNLPNTLTEENIVEVKSYFNNTCPLSGDIDNLVIDHFIPLNTGKVGTIPENIIPLSHSLNSSKKDANPFEWIKTRPEISYDKFERVVEYLSEKMEMDVSEYKEFVYKCFEEGGE